ncbi:MAG: hypothetical protein ACR2PW_01885 [Gammaproteobacteria bacterium]
MVHLISVLTGPFDDRIVRLAIGSLALLLSFLGVVAYLVSPSEVGSISSTYYLGGLHRDLFVGTLFSLGVMFFVYRGVPGYLFPRWLVLLTAPLPIVIALAPCGCGKNAPSMHALISTVHGLSAVVFIFLLLWLNIALYRRAKHNEESGDRSARTRARIYLFTTLVMSGILALRIFFPILDHGQNLLSILALEVGILWAFALAWFTAGTENASS